MQAIFSLRETRKKCSRWYKYPLVCWHQEDGERWCRTRLCLPHPRLKTTCSPLQNTLPCTFLPGRMCSGQKTCPVPKMYGMCILRRDLGLKNRKKQRSHSQITWKGCVHFALHYHKCAARWRTPLRIQFVMTTT